MSIVTIPAASSGTGFQPGSADALPSSPSSYDDEFTTLAGWTTMGTLDGGTPEVTTRPSHLHLKRTTANTNEIAGIYKAAPAAPFTVTAKVAEVVADPVGVWGAGLLLTEASPGKLFELAFFSRTGYGYWNDFLTGTWSSPPTGRVGTVDRNMEFAVPLPFKYIRARVLSGGTTADIAFSEDGFIFYTPSTAVALGLTVANVGLCVAGYDGSGRQAEAMFDWVRFT